jgi:hypothetical protein
MTREGSHRSSTSKQRNANEMHLVVLEIEKIDYQGSNPKFYVGALFLLLHTYAYRLQR